MNGPSPPLRTLAVVADEEPILCLKTIDFLTDEGFEVIDVGDAAQALLFTDIRMPGAYDGLALAHEVAVRWPGTRIIVCSALQRPGASTMAMGAHFFDRPFLASAVRKVLR